MSYALWDGNEKQGSLVQKYKLDKLEGKIAPIIDHIDHEIKFSRNVMIQPWKTVKSTGLV